MPIGCRSAVIFFQGDEDAVVPPNQTEAMVEALRRKGNPVGYLLFAGEQHGFRKSANIQRCLDAELAFYAIEVFRTGLTFEAAGRRRLGKGANRHSALAMCTSQPCPRAENVRRRCRHSRDCAWARARDTSGVYSGCRYRG